MDSVVLKMWRESVAEFRKKNKGAKIDVLAEEGEKAIKKRKIVAGKVEVDEKKVSEVALLAGRVTERQFRAVREHEEAKRAESAKPTVSKKRQQDAKLNEAWEKISTLRNEEEIRKSIIRAASLPQTLADLETKAKNFAAHKEATLRK